MSEKQKSAKMNDPCYGLALSKYWKGEKICRQTYNVNQPEFASERLLICIAISHRVFQNETTNCIKINQPFRH